MYFAYILRSNKDKRYYYGSTQNVEDRINRHNRGLVKSTKGRKPLTLIYAEEFETRSEAFKREMFFKSIEGYIWLTEHRIIG